MYVSWFCVPFMFYIFILFNINAPPLCFLLGLRAFVGRFSLCISYPLHDLLFTLFMHLIRTEMGLISFLPPRSITMNFVPGLSMALLAPSQAIWTYMEAASGSKAIVNWSPAIPACGDKCSVKVYFICFFGLPRRDAVDGG